MASFFKKKLKGHNSSDVLNEKKEKSNDKNIIENPPITNNNISSTSNYNDSKQEKNNSTSDKNQAANIKLSNKTNEENTYNETQTTKNNSNNNNTNKMPTNESSDSNYSKINESDTENKSIWIDVTYDPFNGIQTTSDCMDLVDVDGTKQHHLVIADFGNIRNNKYMKSGSLVSINEDNININISNDNDLQNSKNMNDKKKMLKQKGSSLLLSKHDIALNNNKTDISVLKIFKDDHVETKIDLPDIPRAICSFYSDIQVGIHPTIAIAIGTTIYMYRDRYPYIKMTLPPVEANPIEEKAWENAISKIKNINKIYNRNNMNIKVTDISDSNLSLNENSNPKNIADKESLNEPISNSPEQNEELHSKLVATVTELVNNLSPLRNNGVIQLTQISIEFLALEDLEMKIAYLVGNLDINISIEPTITAMTTIKKNRDDEESLSYLVVGVNEKIVYIVNPNGCQVIEKFQLSSSIQLMSVYGFYDSSYHIVVGCFDGSLYYLTSNSCYKIVQLEFLPIGIVTFEKSLIVGCMNNTLYSYSLSGKKKYSISMPSPIVNIKEIPGQMKKIKCYAVSLQNNEVRIFSDKNLILTIPTPDIITGMVFGKFEREQNGLIMATKSGGLIIKFLKRNATSTLQDINLKPPIEQKQPIIVPKKTRLYINQTVREKENPKEIHSVFQRDLFRIKLIAARSYVRTFQNTLNPISVTPTSKIKMMLEVMGINVNFKIRLDIINIGTNIAKDLYLVFDYDDVLFTIEKPMINIPIILPGINYTIDCLIKQNIDALEKETDNQIKVLLCEKGQILPLVTGMADVGMCQDLLETYG